jgi:hypothetical protein
MREFKDGISGRTRTEGEAAELEPAAASDGTG